MRAGSTSWAARCTSSFRFLVWAGTEAHMTYRRRGQTMKRVRWLLAVAAVLLVGGCASGGPSMGAPPSVNVTGRWLGNWTFDPVSMGGGQIVMNLNQVGAEVNGNLTVTGPAINRPSTIQATVEGNQLVMRGRISGRLTVTGDQMSGQVDGVLPATVNAQRQK